MNTMPDLPRHWAVVDDDAALADLLAEALRELGLAEVEQFTSAFAVLLRPGAPFGAFDLVVTDRDMPGLDGMEFARRLHTVSPGAKIVLVTAHNEDLTADALRRAGISAVLPKPFSLPQLERIVRSLVGTPVPTNAVCMAATERRAA